ncbi:valine--tRNA ligase [Thermoleptolyngbya sichuanensis XZ-Cy5]|uniref:valine--tRNA ligase n=1 Tax=Thermoleptolyngbya sichuanensis TaxID=2885951 RepID=UPI00240DBC7A|nr:valine--tRNA ligase [Thermoleptolyngbya sichuanensis]MDG2615722.1 valine--tRNA ligase [Thermoleptolyngbya sichuanensis XZ-Cy5]
MTATIPNLPSQYDAAIAEPKWQRYWEERQVFKADPNAPGEPYCIVIPPPNVTGSLHMGHAFEHALIDVLVRYHRMIGRNTLWLPGTDHASIAVQTLLEKELRQQGKTRYDVGREAFLKRAWEWKEESGGTIVGQLRRLGLSVDWSRERFTMDEGLSRAVLHSFKQLYDEGLIYRGQYMVNWCPASQSAVSDLEVENQEVNGHLWHFRYPLTDGSGFVEVATTRPETMLGDTAVAVNPGDTRYQHLLGKTIRLPITGREIPIIADDYVDASFGTGAVKITPAHDPNDFEMGKRHNLPFINVMNKDGTMNEVAGPFQGLDRFEARKQVVQRLQDEGFLVKVEDYKTTVPYSDRGKVPIEPLLSTQWFVKIRPLADAALDRLDNYNEPEFIPERWKKVYRDWLVSLRDWCISRQLWWGHQIPAYYAVSETGGEITDETPFVVAMSEDEARSHLLARYGDSVQIQQDPDVLDTWFSSGLWPFSTMGWPDQTTDLATYYPTTTLVTGFDIIFFWVARMTMMAQHFTGKMPFQYVYIHGLVRDENNKKMSKSANNGIDPLLLINKYGTDALRYTLVKEVVGAGQDIRLEYNRKTDESPSVEASRNFTNKLWNASRFVMMNLDGQTPAQLGEPGSEGLEMSDRWILSRYHQTIQQTRHQIDNFGLGEAAKGLYEFIWGDFCDWYIELVKSRLQDTSAGDRRRAAQQTLATVLEGTLRLLHPFMPHVTEEIWHTLTQTGEEATLALQPYPVADPQRINSNLEDQFGLIFDTIRTVRNLRAEADIKPGVKIRTVLQTDNAQERAILTAGQTYIKDLAKIESLSIPEPVSVPTTPSDSLPAPNEFEAEALHLAQEAAEAAYKAVEGVNFGSLERYRKLIVTLGLVVALVLVSRTLLATVHSLNGLILVTPLLKLLGFGYTIWFAIRYLSTSQKRREFGELVNRVVTDILGEASPSDARPTMPKIPSPQSTKPVPVPQVQEVPTPPGGTPQAMVGVVRTVQVSVPLAGVVDVAALRAKLEKDLAKTTAEAESLRSRLSNANFVDRAPAEVVQGVRDALAEAETQAAILRDRLSRL